VASTGCCTLNIVETLARSSSDIAVKIAVQSQTISLTRKKVLCIVKRQEASKHMESTKTVTVRLTDTEHGTQLPPFPTIIGWFVYPLGGVISLPTCVR